MTRKHFIRLLCAALLLTAAAASSGTHAQTAEEPELTTEPVAPGMTLIREAGQPLSDNILALSGPDGILLVDNGYPETAKALRKVLRGLGPGPVRIIVNTHFHHAQANAAFAGEAVIVAQRRARERMTRRVEMYGVMPVGPWAESALPQIVFDDEMTIHFNGEEIRLVHFPDGHTDGDTVVFFKKANVVATGDLFVPLLGVCDLANGCRWPAYLAGIRRLLEMVPKDAKIVPGHHRLSTYRDLEELDRMLREVTELVRRQIAEGRTLEEIKTRGLPARWREWEERGIDAAFFLTNVHEGLLKEKGEEK